MKTTDGSVPKYLFHEGTNYLSYEYLGVHVRRLDDGGLMYTFRTWAPSCAYVGLVSDFTGWDTPLSLTRVSDGGIWEAHLRRQYSLAQSKYKFLIKNDYTSCMKGDPYAFEYEGELGGASVIPPDIPYAFSDENWLDHRRIIMTARDSTLLPSCVNIYEIDSSLYAQEDAKHTYDSLAETLIPYLKYMGYTHILMRQFGDGAYFAPDASLGGRDALRRFVDRLHRNGIGVILKALPPCVDSTHFGLKNFNLSTCYEISAENLRFDLAKREVKSYVLSNVEFWIRQYHADGIYIETSLFDDHADIMQELQNKLKTEFPDVLFISDCKTGNKDAGDELKITDANKGTSETKEADVTKDSVKSGLTLVDRGGQRGFPRLLNIPEEFDFSDDLPDFHVADDSVEGWRIKCVLQMTLPGKKLSICGCEYGKGIRGFCTSASPYNIPAGVQHDYFEFFAALGRLCISSPELWTLDFCKSGYRRYSQCGSNVILFGRYDGKGGELAVAASLEYKDKVNVKIPIENAGHFRLVFTSTGYCDSIPEELDSITDESGMYIEFTLPPMSAAIFRRDSGNFKARI